MNHQVRRISNRPFGQPLSIERNREQGSRFMWILRIAFVVSFVLCGTRFTHIQLAPLINLSSTMIVPIGFCLSVCLALLLNRSSYVLLGFSTLMLAGFCIVDVQGNMLSWGGLLLWLAASGSIFIVTLDHYAQHIMPSKDIERSVLDTHPHLMLLFKYAFRQIKPFDIDTPTLNESFNMLGVGMLPSYQAMRASTGEQKFIYTPGQAILKHDQKVDSVIDLRPYHQQKREWLRTQDGIYLQVTLSVVYSVTRPQNSPDTIGWSYSEDALLKVNSHMLTAVCNKAMDLMKKAFSRHPLNELECLYVGSGKPFQLAVQSVFDELADIYRPKGITIDSVDILQVERQKAIIESRTENWVSEMQPLPPEPEVKKLPTEDDWRMQLDVLDDIKKHIDLLRNQSNSSMGSALADRLDMILYEVAADGMLQTLIPPLPDDQ